MMPTSERLDSKDSIGPLALTQSLPRRILRMPSVRTGLALTVLVLLIAVVGPFVSPYSPTEFVGIPDAPAGVVGVFGTDSLGRDVLSRFLHGGWLLILLAAIATLVGVGGGALIGIAAAYSRGKVDEFLMRTGDVLLAFPNLVLALLFLSMLGAKLWLLVLLIAVGHMPRVARVVRGSAMSVVENDFVKYSRLIGVHRLRIMLTDVVPSISGTLSVEFGLRFTYAIGGLAGLSFLGLGVQPPTPDWGLMINENRAAMLVQPWSVLLPVLAIGILTVGTNLVTNGMSQAVIGADR